MGKIKNDNKTTRHFRVIGEPKRKTDIPAMVFECVYNRNTSF